MTWERLDDTSSCLLSCDKARGVWGGVFCRGEPPVSDRFLLLGEAEPEERRDATAGLEGAYGEAEELAGFEMTAVTGGADMTFVMVLDVRVLLRILNGGDTG